MTATTARRTLGIATLPLLTLAAQAQAAEPYEKPDDSWIHISGTVADPTDDAFVLDYGGGTILVEMDDWDRYGDAYALSEGDAVTVSGRIDDDLYEVASIEAGSVFVQDLNTYFYASSADEESMRTGWFETYPVVLSETTVHGEVTMVDEEGERFRVGAGPAAITIETDFMTYDPLDDIGFQQIDEGDSVVVTGSVDERFLEDGVLQATTVITMDADAPS